MKKYLNVVTAFLLVIFCALSSVAFACEAVPEYPPQKAALLNQARASVVDLEDGNDQISLFVNTSIATPSDHNYVTNTQKIKISLKATKKTTLTIYLYDTDGNFLGGSTKEIGTVFNTSWTFSNLVHGTQYYFIAENVGQVDVTLSGYVSG